jgi:16S rRNA (adenine1518-N6/adenine1519-N6)-dimethyltransferase
MPAGRPDRGGGRPAEPAAGAPPDLGSAREVRALLARHGLRPDKGFGQNFLIDRQALASVVAAADPPPGATVLEVGPGLGVLTRALAERGARVLALELDARLLPALRETTDRYPERVEVRRLDALRFDHREMPAGSFLASNLPYQIATALLAEALASGRYRRIGVLVQREVAERIVAGPGDPGFGAFSLVCRHYAEARIVRTVAPGCFLPPPKVTSAVVRIEPRPGVAPDPATFALIRAGFRHRRKTLRWNLTAAGLAPERVAAALQELGLDPRVRAEALDLDTWRALRARLPSPEPP